MTRNELVKALNDNPKSTNPALATGATITTISGILYVILRWAFPKIPDEVLASGIAGFAIAIPFMTSWIIRGKVWSPASVNTVVDEQVKTALETVKKLDTPHLQHIPRPMTLEESDALKAEFTKNFPLSKQPLIEDPDKMPPFTS